MSLKTLTLALAAAAAAAVGAAAELQAAGAIRPDHEQKWNALRVQLDQIAAAANEVDAGAEDVAPETPDAAAFADLKHSVETLALTVDHLADKLDKA